LDWLYQNKSFIIAKMDACGILLVMNPIDTALLRLQIVNKLL